MSVDRAAARQRAIEAKELVNRGVAPSWALARSLSDLVLSLADDADWLQKRFQMADDAHAGALRTAKHFADQLHKAEAERDAILDAANVRQGLNAVEVGRLKAAIESHKCTEVFTASDGAPAIRVNDGVEL